MNPTWFALLPEWIAALTLVFLLLAAIQKPAGPRPLRSFFHIFDAGCLTTLCALVLVFANPVKIGAVFIHDPLAIFFKVFFLGTVFTISQMSRSFFEGRQESSPEYFLILWSSLIGLFFLVSANDFLLLFIALETVTLSFYVMAAYLKRDLLSIEAGLKYLVLGSLASAFLIYGISLLYTAAGSLSFAAVRAAFAANPHAPLFLMGILLLFSGLGFKVASVPFQLWVPDVYEGAPTPTVAYLSVGSKAAGFALLVRLFFSVFDAFAVERALLFSVLAAMTLLYGNLGALVQTNVKRLFAYSSIGHAGYLLIGIAAGKILGMAAVLYYLAAYGVTNLAAFLVINRVGTALGNDHVETYAGLAKRSPFLAGCFFVALLSLAGVPPLAGFFGKFLILLAAVRAHLAWLALLGALAVAVALYYYLGLVRKMYLEAPHEDRPIETSLAERVLLITLLLGIFFLGFWQAPLYNLISLITQSL